MAIRKNLLPSAYQQVEYIESSGTQYIDTGYYATNTSGINIDYAYTASGNAGLCGIFQNQRPRTDTLFITTHSGNTSGTMNLISQGNSITNNVVPALGTKYNGKINYLNDGKLILNYTTTGDNGTNGVVSSRTIKLFCRDSGGNLAYTNARIYMCKISEGENIVRNFIPCYRKSDNEIGLYDLVGGTFYTNAGSGTFAKGNDYVPQVKYIYKGSTQIIKRYKGTNLIYQSSLLPTGYIRLDYIENPDQNAYIDTGILPDDTTGFKVRMSVNNITADLYYLGCREDNQTDSRFGLGVYNGHTYMAFGTYYSDANNWTITRDTPFVAKNNYKNSRVATMNGLNPVSVGTLSGITFTRNIYLFKSNQATTQLTANCRIYECEITQGTTVVAHFIPCFDNNGVACMYDTIRQQTFYSAGSSDFITDYVPPIILPSGYTLLEYLESDGTGQYIDTGYIATQTTSIECDFMITQHNSNLLNYVYGEYLASRACGIYISSTANVYGILYGSVDRNTNISRVFNEKVHSILNSSSLTINETTENVGYNNTYTAPYSLYLFKGNGSTRPGMIGRIYYMLIREARGVASRYLVPCLDNNGVPCMYDIITKQTYYNAGTGTFYFAVGGKLPTGYKHIKYIQSWNDGSSITSPPRPRIEIPFEYKDTMTLRWIEASDSQANNLAIYSGTTRMAFLNGWTSSGKITARYDRTSIASSVTPSAGQIYDLRLASDGFYVDGIKQGDAVSVDYPNDTVIVNCLKSGGYYASISKNYLIQVIDQNGNILLNAVPCLDDNNEPCMYDTISKTKITKTPSDANDFLYEE